MAVMASSFAVDILSALFLSTRSWSLYLVQAGQRRDPFCKQINSHFWSLTVRMKLDESSLSARELEQSIKALTLPWQSTATFPGFFSSSSKNFGSGLPAQDLADCTVLSTDVSSVKLVMVFGRL